MGEEYCETADELDIDRTQRITVELSQLVNNYMRLKQFTTSICFKDIDEVHKDLLIKQRNVMKEYIAILTERIKLF